MQVIKKVQGLLPLLVVLLSDCDLLARHLSLPTHTRPAHGDKEGAAAGEQHSQAPSFRVLGALTLSAGFALATPFAAAPVVALGISSGMFAAVGLVLFEHAVRSSASDENSHKISQTAGNGASRERMDDAPTRAQQLVVLRDVALVMALVCGLAAYLMEPRITSDMVSWEPIYRFGETSMKAVRHYRTVQLVGVFVVVNVFINGLTFFMVSHSLSFASRCNKDLMSFRRRLASLCHDRVCTRGSLSPEAYNMTPNMLLILTH